MSLLAIPVHTHSLTYTHLQSPSHTYVHTHNTHTHSLTYTRTHIHTTAVTITHINIFASIQAQARSQYCSMQSSCHFVEYMRNTMPGNKRPARPARCLACRHTYRSIHRIELYRKIHTKSLLYIAVDTLIHQYNT